MAIPVALIFDLIDLYTALWATVITIVDTISMLTYLCHDDDTGIEASNVYELVYQSKQQNSEIIRQMESEENSLEEDLEQ